MVYSAYITRHTARFNTPCRQKISPIDISIVQRVLNSHSVCQKASLSSNKRRSLLVDELAVSVDEGTGKSMFIDKES